MKVSSAKLKNLQRNYNDNLQQYIYNWQEGGVDSEQTNYRYNGEAIYLSYKTGNSVSNPNARWLHGAGVDEPLIRYGSDGSITNYHQDGRNSAVLTTSANDGAVIATQRFDAFGNQQAANDSIGQYGFTGREQDASGLMYYRARYYDPSKGRFTQRDPKGMIDGINQYAYVRNNPVNRVDPNGTVSISTNNYSSLNNNYFSSGGSSNQSLFDISPMFNMDSIGMMADSLKSPVAATLNRFNPFNDFRVKVPPSRTIDFSIPANGTVNDKFQNVDGRFDVKISNPSRRNTEIEGVIHQPVKDGGVPSRIRIPDRKNLRRNSPFERQLLDPGFNRDIDFRIKNHGPAPIDVEFKINPRIIIDDGNRLLS